MGRFHGSARAPIFLLMSSCNPFITLLSHSNFIHVFRNVVIIDGSIFGYSLSFLPEVEASTKLFLASMKVPRVHSKSNSTSFDGALRTQVLSFGCFPLSSHIEIPLQSTMFMFETSSRDSYLIICRF